MQRILRAGFLVAAVFLGCLLMGCTPEKAQALRTAAVQFRSESLAAINALEVMLDKEIAEPPRSETEAAGQFAKNLLELPASQPLSAEIIRRALNPDAVTLNPEVAQRKANLFGEVRAQYAAFAAIFDQLEAGSFLARDAVARATPYADKLTLQMAAFAKSVTEHPPQLIQFRNALIARMDAARKDAALSAEEKSRRLRELRDEWLLLEAGERDLQRSVVELCLKAATLGREVSRLSRTYGDLSLEDINFAVQRALDVAGQLTGKDVTALAAKASEVYASIRDDSIWSSVAGQTLDEINKVRASQSGPPQ